MKIRLLALATGVALVAGAGFAPEARAASTAPVYSGAGWRIWTENQIHSLDSAPYTFTFASTAARTKLTPYIKAAASQLATITGVTFIVSTTVEAPPTAGCPAWHHLIVGLKYRPSGIRGESITATCTTTNPGQPSNYAAWGGTAMIDTEWFYSHWFTADATLNSVRIKNGITHETGHLVGLDHPNKDLNKDGKVTLTECQRTVHGYLPVMCGSAGGYTFKSGGGKFTSRDIPGLQQLVKNRGLG